MRSAPRSLVWSLIWTASSLTTSHSLRAMCGALQRASCSGVSHLKASWAAAKYSRNVRWVNGVQILPACRRADVAEDPHPAFAEADELCRCFPGVILRLEAPPMQECGGLAD